MALQRNLKALGTFGYQTMARRNTVYIQYMPRTLRLRAHQPREVSALRAAARAAGGAHRGAAVVQPPSTRDDRLLVVLDRRELH